MSKYPWPHVAPKDYAARIVFLTSKLETMYRYGVEQDLLRAELSWLNKQIEDRISAQTAITQPNQRAWVGQQAPL